MCVSVGGVLCVGKRKIHKIKELIGLTLLYFKMDVMPLVSETKMADARKQSVSGTHWQGEPRS